MIFHRRLSSMQYRRRNQCLYRYLALLILVRVLLLAWIPDTTEVTILMKQFAVLPSKCSYSLGGGCFDLWVAEQMPIEAVAESGKIHVIVSHCMHSLDWLDTYLSQIEVASISVYSKCGHNVTGEPKRSKVFLLDNVGRCDHTYAHWISHASAYFSSESHDIALFLKDDLDNTNIHQKSDGWKSATELVRISSNLGFACGMKPSSFVNGTFSVYHYTPSLLSFAKYFYVQNAKKYGHNREAVLNDTSFKSKYASMKDWTVDVEAYDAIPHNLTQVCYGGVFAARLDRILSKSHRMWLKIEQSLARSDNLEEGHFAERIWAPLLAVPLTPTEQQRIWRHGDSVMKWVGSYWGTLYHSKEVN